MSVVTRPGRPIARWRRAPPGGRVGPGRSVQLLGADGLAPWMPLAMKSTSRPRALAPANVGGKSVTDAEHPRAVQRAAHSCSSWTGRSRRSQDRCLPAMVPCRRGSRKAGQRAAAVASFLRAERRCRGWRKSGSRPLSMQAPKRSRCRGSVVLVVVRTRDRDEGDPRAGEAGRKARKGHRRGRTELPAGPGARSRAARDGVAPR